MAEPLDDLRQRWAEEARERAELDAVVEDDLEDDLADDDELLDEDEVLVDGEAAIERLRQEPDDDQPNWSRERGEQDPNPNPGGTRT